MTKKRKLNSKNPKYRTQAEVQSTTKEVDKRVLIAEAKGTKVYATFSRVNNSSTSKLLTIFGINGKSGVNGDTTLKELLDFNNNTPIKFKS